MRDDRTHWEERYRTRTDAIAEAKPSGFLVQNAALVRGRVLDLACGAGRNSIFLARRGDTVDAVDIAFAGLKQVRDVAIAEGLKMNFVQADLCEFPLPRERYDTVVNIRYLERSLFPPMARALRPGGVLIFETFLIDQREHGHPRNPEFLLRHGELREAFQSLECLHYEEGLVASEEGSAYLARLVARRAGIRGS